MTQFEQVMKEAIEEWAKIEDTEEFLDYGQGLDISGFCTENGERVVYFANGLYYTPYGCRMGENDGEAQKHIIDTLEECGIDFAEG